METKSIIILLTVVFAVASIMSICEASLLDSVIKTKGGGNVNIAELISKIPADSRAIISINWENLAKTDLIDFGIKSVMGEANAFNEIGIDLKKDIKHIVIGLTFDEEPDYLPSFYGVIAGTFDEKKIIDSLKNEGAKIDTTKITDKTVYSINNLYVNFTKPGMLFAGIPWGEHDDPIKKMLAVGGANLANNPEMAELIKKTDTSATAWGAVIVPEGIREEMADEEEGPYNKRSIQTAFFSFNYAEKVILKASINFSEVGESGKFVKFFTDQIAAITNEEERMPKEIVELLKNVRITAEDKAANFLFEIEAKKLQEIIKSLMAGTGMPVEEDSRPPIQEEEFIIIDEED